MKIRIKFLEELLGSQPNNAEVHAKYIAALSPDATTIEDEVAAIGPEAVEKAAMTVFPREDGKPFLYDYQVKGFFKDSCSALARVSSTRSSKIKAYRKVIDGLLFVLPRKSFFAIAGEIGSCQRPLRAETAQGPRVALANSETIPAGSTVEFEIQLLDEAHEKLVCEWLDYGRLRGLGQWRNSGKGRFSWEKLE